MTLPDRPRLRALEVLPVVEGGRRSIVLRDPLGLAQGIAILPLPIVPIALALDGTRTLVEIHREAAGQMDELPMEVVEEVVRQLEEAHFLEGAGFETHRSDVIERFRASPARAAAHAGGAYEADRAALGAQIDAMHAAYGSAARSVGPDLPPVLPSRRLRGLVAPHIDLRRGARAYGAAYAALRSAADATVFVVFGTAHAPVERPWAITEKSYATPLGIVPTDATLVRDIERRFGGDARRDELAHMNEHSIEFQAVMLRHALPDRELSIVPILCGRLRPGTAETEDLIGAVQGALAADGRKACVIAGADLAHVGPRFGDASAYSPAARSALEVRDRESMALVGAGDGPGFFNHVAEDDETRRVCGTSPIYATLGVLGAAAGELLMYEQNVDASDGSIVSYAALTLR